MDESVSRADLDRAASIERAIKSFNLETRVWNTLETEHIEGLHNATRATLESRVGCKRIGLETLSESPRRAATLENAPSGSV